MQTRLCSIEDFENLKSIILSFDRMYGIDTVAEGIQQHHIEVVELALKSPTWNVFAVENKDGNILGFTLQRFVTDKEWILMLTYIANPGGNQYNASKAGAVLLESMVKNAEENGITEFWYVVRDSSKKRLGLTLSYTKYVSDNYIFEDVETLPPLTETKYQKVAEYIIPWINGKNLKTIVIRHGFLKK